MGRFWAALGALVFASVLAFLLAEAAPGDPVEMMLQQQGIVDQQTLDQARRELGLDLPPGKRYLIWWNRILHGDWGTSIVSGRPVLEDLTSHMWPTVQLAIVSLGVATLGGVLGGVLIARYRHKWFAAPVRGLTTLGVSLPGYLYGVLLILVGAVALDLFPTSGYGEPRHLVLPALSLIAGILCYFFVVTYYRVCEFSDKEFVKCARAQGFPESSIWFKQILKSAVLPIVSYWGAVLANLMAGSVVIETLFAWPGLGKLAVDAVFSRDYPVIQGYVLFVTAMVIVINLFIDILSKWIDPLFAGKT